MTLPSVEIPDLPAELHRLLDQVPAGAVTTYGDLARALGDVAAARWVGAYLAHHSHSEDCPCHRVVRQTGEIGLYVAGDPHAKAGLLGQEGIVVADGRVPLRELRFSEFGSSAPLLALRERQERLPGELRLTPLKASVRTIAGVDVSYASPASGVAAYVKLDAATGEMLWSTTVRAAVTFPYIPGYLTFRELPLHRALFEQVRGENQEADVTLVDGNGILHPRRAGSASACGVAVAARTIGIGKKLLCGSVSLDGLVPGEARPVRHQGEQIGVAMRSGTRNRPFFASSRTSNRHTRDDRRRSAITRPTTAAAAHLSRRPPQSPGSRETHRPLKTRRGASRPRRRASSDPSVSLADWIPAFAGMTTNSSTSVLKATLLPSVRPRQPNYCFALIASSSCSARKTISTSLCFRAPSSFGFAASPSSAKSFWACSRCRH